MKEGLWFPKVHRGPCKATIEGALMRLEGVVDASVDLDSTRVPVDSIKFGSIA